MAAAHLISHSRRHGKWDILRAARHSQKIARFSDFDSIGNHYWFVTQPSEKRRSEQRSANMANISRNSISRQLFVSTFFRVMYSLLLLTCEMINVWKFHVLLRSNWKTNGMFSIKAHTFYIDSKNARTREKENNTRMKNVNENVCATQKKGKITVTSTIRAIQCHIQYWIYLQALHVRTLSTKFKLDEQRLYCRMANPAQEGKRFLLNYSGFHDPLFFN